MSVHRAERLLTVDSVSLTLGGKRILRDVDVNINNLQRDHQTTGQIIAFLGPSGVGKTQFLRIVAGLQQPDSGHVSLGPNFIPVKVGAVGLVSQNYILYQNRTVLGNLRVAAMRHNHNGMNMIQGLLTLLSRRKDATRKATEMLLRFDDEEKKLTKGINRYPSEFSGGQRQRIAIAQQLLCSDHFLLMDEPTAGLDFETKNRVGNLIQEVANQDDLNTIIMVTHDINSALAIADTVWLMGRDRNSNGEIIPGARIVDQYDTIERGLMWHPEVRKEPAYSALVREIEDRFKQL